MAREFAVAIDGLVRGFPPHDRGVVGGQLRRAALSIPANVAEGCGKGSRRETVRFIQIASGSAREVENHLLLAGDLGYLDAPTREQLLATVMAIQRMLYRLMQKLGEVKA